MTYGGWVDENKDPTRHRCRYIESLFAIVFLGLLLFLFTEN